MSILGIDPGQAGALAWLSPVGAILRVEDMPVVTLRVGGSKRNRVDTAGLAALIRSARPDHVIVERVGGRPTDAAVWAWNFGWAAGIVEGVVTTLGLPLTYVQPHAWRRSMAVNLPAGSTAAERKEASRQRALQLWPDHAEAFHRKLDADRAEAALMALWGLQCAAVGGAA